MGGYDTGDGEDSYYVAEMIDFNISGTEVRKGVLDDSRTLVLEQPIKSSALKKIAQDSVNNYCRLMIHYNKKSAAADSVVAAAVGYNSVLMPKIVLADTVKSEIKTDPIALTSMWLASNKKYINMDFAIMTDGAASKPHYLGLVCDSIVRRQQSTDIFIRISHNQNGHVAAYHEYCLMSISRKQLEKLVTDGGTKPTSLRAAGDAETDGLMPFKVIIGVPTFSGTATREFWL